MLRPLLGILFTTVLAAFSVHSTPAPTSVCVLKLHCREKCNEYKTSLSNYNMRYANYIARALTRTPYSCELLAYHLRVVIIKRFSIALFVLIITLLVYIQGL